MRCAVHPCAGVGRRSLITLSCGIGFVAEVAAVALLVFGIILVPNLPLQLDLSEVKNWYVGLTDCYAHCTPAHPIQY